MLKRSLLTLLALSWFAGCGGDGPASMEFLEISPSQPRIGDVITVRFKLTDSRGIALAGAPVTFKLESPNAAVTLSPSSAVSLKGSGIAETQLVVKGRVASVIVSASSGGRTVRSPAISVAGSLPNGRQMTFQCGSVAGSASGGIHAIGAYDDTRNLIAGVKLRCYAHVADRNGDGVAGAQVSFITEAGTIGATGTTGADVVGNTEVLYKTSYPLPKDVNNGTFTWIVPQNDANNTGDYLAPLWMEPFMWVANPIQTPRPQPAQGNSFSEPSRKDPLRKSPTNATITNNPRDNLVAMIAVTAGEEGFTDMNNNGVWDADEPFDDLTEPFVDSNDNGTWDNDEKFIDANNNGKWDGKNLQWDGATLIWAQERILWTGVPHELDSVSANGALFKALAPIQLLCPPGSTAGQSCPVAGPVPVEFVISDPWYNSMAQNSDGDGCELIIPEKSPVDALPKRFNSGFRFTYPAATYGHFTVVDTRDPNAAPADQIPKRAQPAPFALTVNCSFTASPEGGHTVVVSGGSLSGTIE